MYKFLVNKMMLDKSLNYPDYDQPVAGLTVKVAGESYVQCPWLVITWLSPHHAAFLLGFRSFANATGECEEAHYGACQGCTGLQHVRSASCVDANIVEEVTGRLLFLSDTGGTSAQ